MTDYGALGTLFATIGLAVATVALVWHSSNLVKATKNLASTQIIPRLTLRHPLRHVDESDEGLPEGVSSSWWVVQVINHGAGTAFKVEILAEQRESRLIANSPAPNRDIIVGGIKEFFLDHWEPNQSIFAEYEDAQGKQYRTQLFPVYSVSGTQLADSFFEESEHPPE